MDTTPVDPTAPQAAFPFVVGCQRSGTTLLQTMLDAHPQLAIPPESHFIVPLAKRLGPGAELDDAGRDRLVDALTERRRFADWRMDHGEVAAIVERSGPRDLAEAIRALFAAWAGRAGKTRYGDKTPRYVRYMPLLGELFPEARFVHLIRDGRDVTLSMIEAFKRGPQTAVEGAMYWRADVEAGRRHGRDLGPERYLEARYEDMVADQEGVLRAICDFAELEFEERMLRHGEHAERVLEGYRDPAHHPNLARATASRRDWRKEMEADDVRRFEVLAGDLLDRLFYRRGGGREGRGGLLFGPPGTMPVAGDESSADLLAAEMRVLRNRFARTRRSARRAERRLRRLRRSGWWRAGRRLAALNPARIRAKGRR